MKHGDCWEDRKHQEHARRLQDGVSALRLLHVRWKSGQTAAHVGQQHVSVLHLIALAAPRRHVAHQHRET